MERLTGGKYKSFLESYVSIYDMGSGDAQEQEDIQEFVQLIDELVEEGCDLSEFDYNALYEYYLEESKAKAALELIKSGIRSALKMPAAAPIRKTLAKGVVKGGAEAVTKAARDVAGGVANVAGTAYRGVRDIATKHPIKTAAGIAAAAYDLSKGEKSLISRGAGLAGKGLSAAERAVYGGGQSPTAAPSNPTPSSAEPSKPKSLKILGGKVVGYDHFDPLSASNGDLLDETHNNGDTEIVEGRDFALQGGKPGFTVKDKSGTRWVPIDTKTFDKKELDKLTADYTRRRGSAQIEKDIKAHKDAKAKQDAARKPQAPSTPAKPSTPSTPSTPSSTPSTPSAPPSGKSTPTPTPEKPKTSSASASTADKIKGGLETYKAQVKSGDVKGAEATGKATWAAANPKLAAAAAERERTRGTSATTNPLMKDFKSSLPAPKAAETTTAKPASTPEISVSKNPEMNKVADRLSKNPLGVKKEAYDIVLDYVLSTGQADTIDEALYVMMEMDSNCIQSIVETVG